MKLREINECNLGRIRNWRNSDTVMPYCRQYRPLTERDMLVWYNRLREDHDYNLTNDFFLMEKEHTLIGVCGMTRIDWRNSKAELSFYIGEPAWNTTDVVHEGIRAILRYAFDTLAIHKVYFPVYQHNPNLEMYKAIMRHEYTAKNEYYWDGKLQDRIVLVAYASTFEVDYGEDD